MRWPDGGPGEPDFGDAIDEAIDRIQEPPVLSLSPLRDTGDVSVNPDSRTLLSACPEVDRG